MGIKLLTCIVCPIGCRMEATKVPLQETEYLVTGYKCVRGESYAYQEITNPMRILTTTIEIKKSIFTRIPVRTVKPIPKDLIEKCIKLLKGIEIDAPVEKGETVVKNVLGTGVDVITSKSVT